MKKIPLEIITIVKNKKEYLALYLCTADLRGTVVNNRRDIKYYIYVPQICAGVISTVVKNRKEY